MKAFRPRNLILAAAFLLLAAAAIGFARYQAALAMPAVGGEAVTIDIRKGDSLGDICQKLADAGVAVNPVWFRLLAVQQRALTRLKAGEYELAAGLSMADILLLLVGGKAKQHRLTIPEGWNFRQLGQAIANAPGLDRQLDLNDHAQVLAAVASQAGHPEGLFFPDTYFYQKHGSDRELLNRAHQRMQAVLAEEWQGRADGLPLKTPYEALILASIIEKETAIAAERPLVAGVFIRRLRQDMLLQTDPTVIYGMGGAYAGNLRHQDLMAASPYNTYLNKGLPPTPIAMPGRASIHAALHPDDGDALYFVARGDGSHAFSATLAEHNQAVAAYQAHHHGPR